MRDIHFLNRSYEHYEGLPAKSRKKATTIITEMQASVNPEVGIGKPIELREGKFSRKLHLNRRLVYSFDNNAIFIEDIV